ncbi:recombinase family protein [Mediterraneibacter faecis]
MTSRERPLPPEGVYTANWIPYGYKYNPDSIDYLEIDDEVSDAVQYIFAQFIDGIAIKDILPDLEEMGYPTPQRRKVQLGLAARCDESKIDNWNPTAFNQTLFNPIYAGDWLNSGRVWDCAYYYSGEPLPEGTNMPEIEPDHHIALISREDMKKASIMFLKQRADRQSDQAPSTPSTTAQVLEAQGDTSFASLLFCGECGRPMFENEVNFGPAFKFTAYTCSSFTLASGSKCTNRFYRQDEILPTLTSLLENERKQVIKATEQIGSNGEKGNQYQRIEAFLQKQIDSAVDGVRKNMTAASRLKTKNQNGKLSDEDLQKELSRMDTKNRGYEKQVMKALIQVRSFRASCTLDNPWIQAFSQMPENWDPMSDLLLLHKLVERIDLYPDKAPEITLAGMDDKDELMSVLNMKLRGRRS